MAKKRGITLKINLTNRWLYTLIAIGILTIVGVSVYAVDTSKSWHSASQIEGLGSLATKNSVAVDQIEGLGSLATKNSVDFSELPTCGGDKILQVSGGSWGCADVSDSIDLSNLGDIGVNTVRLRIYQEGETFSPGEYGNPINLPPCNAENEGLVAYGRVWHGYSYLTGYHYTGRFLVCSKYHETEGITQYSWAG